MPQDTPSVGQKVEVPGDTVFVAPFIHALSVLQKFRKPTRRQVAEMRRLTR